MADSLTEPASPRRGRLGTERSTSKARRWVSPHHRELKGLVERMAERKSRQCPNTTLEQYKLVRSEVTTSLQIQQQILSFGIATIGLMTAAAGSGLGSAFSDEVLVVFLPLIAYLSVTIWFSEVMRMLRAGGFLMILEKRLDELGDGSLAWECTVASGRLRSPAREDPDQLRLLAVTILFLTIAAAGIVLGWDKASTSEQVFGIAAGVVALVFLLTLFRLRIGELRDMLAEEEKARETRRTGEERRLTSPPAGLPPSVSSRS